MDDPRRIKDLLIDQMNEDYTLFPECQKGYIIDSRKLKFKETASVRRNKRKNKEYAIY